MSAASSLRDRQAAVIREAILDALAGRLDHDDPDDVAMMQVAADAGSPYARCTGTFRPGTPCSTRLDHVVARLGLPREINGADDIGPVFLESARRGAQSPQLVRAMLWTRLGRRARSATGAAG